MKERPTKFNILDLFCGAGGLSWGLDKNPFSKRQSHLILMNRQQIPLRKICPTPKSWSEILLPQKSSPELYL